MLLDVWPQQNERFFAIYVATLHWDFMMTQIHFYVLLLEEQLKCINANFDGKEQLRSIRQCVSKDIINLFLPPFLFLLWNRQDL